MNVNELKDALFARGKAMGFGDMEIAYVSRERFSSRVFKSEVDSYSIAVEGGLGFRGLFGGKMGYAYTEKVDETSIDLLLNGAKASAEIIDSDEVAPIFAGSPAYTELNLYSPALAAVGPDRKITLLKELEAECFRLDPRVVSVNYCNFGSDEGERLIANTKGLSRSEKDNHAYVVLSVVVREGSETKTAFAFKLSRNFADFDAKALAAEAVHEAVSYLGAEPVESKAYPVLIKNTTAASLVAAFLGGFTAENVQKGRSRLKGKVGTAIAGENITFVDDPFRPDGAASRSFDGEGVASKRLTVVEKGVLKSLFYNLKSAAVDGVESTGHGFKPSYKGAVGTAPSNFYLEPGTTSFDDLVASTEEGVLITSLQGLHSGANPISGDFSLAAHGYYIQGGKIVRPVNQITVAGNFFELLGQVETVGADLEFDLPGMGHIGCPTIKVKSLAVTGK